MTTGQTIGQKIKFRRKELGMSAEELGRRLGVHRTTVFRYESGHIEKLPVDILETIAQALNTTPAYFLDWDKDDESNDFGNDIQADIILRMRSDPAFMSVVRTVYNLDAEKFGTLEQMLNTLFK